MSDLKLVIFDCDGTLIDSAAMIIDAAQAAFRMAGSTAPTREIILSATGLSLPRFVAAISPEDNDELHRRVIEAYRELFATTLKGGTTGPMFGGMHACLDELAQAGFLLGIATGKSRRGLEAVLAQHEIADHFVTLKSADDGPSKPHPEILHQAMAETGADPENVVMIGDTGFDMALARNAGVTALGVGWGHQPARELFDAGAIDVVQRVEALSSRVFEVFEDGLAR